MWTRRAKREERGATAIMMALLSTVIFMVGAVAVDMGQVYAKRSALQNNVDQAVLAAAAELTQETGCNPEVVTKAEEYLLEDANEVHGQVALGLQDGDDDNGEITCPGNWRVDLEAPEATVSFGMAKIFEGEESVDVPAEASAQIKSLSGLRGLPMFGVDGCDYGQQTIRDDSGPAPTTPPVPPLTPNSATFNTATFTISPTEVPNTTTSQVLTITGTNLTGATAIGFTGAGGPPDHHEVPASAFISASATQIKVNVPSAVLAIEDVWFVRVLKGTQWSKEQNPNGAQRFTVGDKMYCAASVEGNFGTIDLPRTDTSFDLEWNMILGPQVSLDVHPAPAGECGGDPAPTIESKTTPVEGTNCVTTEPGISISSANDGLVSGKGGKAGRLDTDSTSNCSRNGNSSRTSTSIKGKNINDDVLTCYITNDARIADLIHGTGIGKNALSADIFKSPRYFWIPIVSSEPSTGKKSWPIVDFRSGFITDQALSATHDSPGTISALNGLEAGPSGLRELKVILFSQDALPPTAPAIGRELDYTGSGPKVVVLVK